jgi:UDP-N-acetylglucosamine 2-epimerase (non-hydrolysing)
MKILSVVGARPNFMKIAPFVKAVADHNAARPDAPVRHVLVHSGQHYDPTLSERFFDELGIPAPDHHLNVGSGSHAHQVGMTMIGFEKVLLEEAPDWVVVVGDVNAACACALTAKKHWFRVAHIEAGLRSGDWSMPEETNRVVADRLSDLLFTTCRFADENLAREGVPLSQTQQVGNIMIDTLEAQRAKAAARRPEDVVRANRGAALPPLPSPLFGDEGFAVLTLHRPSNVDEAATLTRNVELIEEFSGRLPIVFPAHPRTIGRLKEFGLWPRLENSARIIVVDPLGYGDLLALTMSARVVLTDSGGIQEECCVVGTPCLTLRANTERPATLAEHGGTNHLVGTEPTALREAFEMALKQPRTPYRPPQWDGHTAGRILERLLKEPRA